MRIAASGPSKRAVCRLHDKVDILQLEDGGTGGNGDNRIPVKRKRCLCERSVKQRHNGRNALLLPGLVGNYYRVRSLRRRTVFINAER